jgi:hypothetical protein
MPTTWQLERMLIHSGVSHCDRMFMVDLHALGVLYAKMLLVGSTDPKMHYVWEFWVGRDRASVSAVRHVLKEWCTKPWWDLVWWWCVENMEALNSPQPYVKCTDEAMQKYGGGIRDRSR